MHKPPLIGSVLVAALLLAAASGATHWSTSPASAGALVDPTTLQPQPPNAVCRADGRQIICDTFVDETLVNEPVFDLSCGTVYETSSYHGAGTRWYVDRLLVKRQVVARFDGTWSLSPSGQAPTVDLAGNYSFRSDWAVPGDESTEITTYHGSNFKVSAPGVGVVIQDAGIWFPDESHRGLFRGFDSPQTDAALCAALTA